MFIQTFYFSMKIYNSMQYGSLFGLDWRGFAGGGQIADLEFEYPYIGGLDIGLNPSRYRRTKSESDAWSGRLPEK